MSMRIAFITFEYPPFIIGGAGTYVMNITYEIAKLGHQVVVFTPEINNFKREKCDINNLEIKRIKINKRLPFKALQFWLRLPKAIERAENENSFDIIHFNGISYWFLKKRVSTAPHVITVHHLVKDAIKSNNLSLISRIRDISGENSIFITFIEKRCIKYADKIIAVSNFTKKQIIETYKIPSEKIEVIYNGINLNGYNFTKYELEEAKKQLNLTEKPVILFVGRVDDHRKGLDLLLKTFKKVLEEIDAVLLVVGKGNQTGARKIAESLGVLENTVFTGFVDEITLKKCYALCDVYVVPSKLEGFGLTILEAMAAGKPVVATNVGAISEIMGDSGVLANSKNEDTLSEAILKILNNNKNQFRQKALNRVKEFAWEKSVKKILEVYNKLNERKEQI